MVVMQAQGAAFARYEVVKPKQVPNSIIFFGFAALAKR
jgi:hypothetical protein